MKKMPGILLFLLLMMTVIPVAFGRELTFQDRVSYQKAVEQVYWNNRIWPAENQHPKPVHDPALTVDQINARVDDYLRKSNALETIWGRPITSTQLQSEIERMAKHTKAPKVLAQLFAALDDDPFLIAELLARQTLADRLIRKSYGRDDRFHAGVKRRALKSTRSTSNIRSFRLSDVDYSEMTWMMGNPDETPDEIQHDEIIYDDAEWREALARLRKVFGVANRRVRLGTKTDEEVGSDDRSLLPLRTMSALQETDEGFQVISILRQDPEAIRIATAAWPKVPFDTWWGRKRDTISGDLAPAVGLFTLPTLTAETFCTPGTWRKFFGQPAPRSWHTAVWTGSEMLIWGGHADYEMVNTGWRYNPSIDSWIPMARSGQAPSRMRHIAVWTGQEMIVWGGYKTSLRNDGGRYNPSADTWTRTATAGAPSARQNHTGVWSGSTMIIWGGNDGITYGLNTGGRYDPVSDQWSATSMLNAPVGRNQHSAIWSGTEMIVWGGGSYVQDAGRYDPVSNSWMPVALAGAPSSRIRHTAVWTGSQMIIWGGYDKNGLSSIGGRYTPETDTWQSMTDADAPVGRSSHTAIWTGSEMIVWGGYGGSPTVLDSGGRYDPSLDVWIPTTQDGAPIARGRHAAIWTGDEMIVWGGDDGAYRTRHMNDGARYDPSLDTWTSVVPGPAPPGTRLHTAVWTGAEMIVWGGIVGDLLPWVYPNTGHRYNPATDTWNATASAGAPPGRAAHTAIWTGTDMIVWGGITYEPPNVYRNDGARYSPGADAWTQTSTVGAPTKRSRHTASWTGREMIVWGGKEGLMASDLVDTGGRYDPITDSWAPTAVNNAPGARIGHTTVWTGHEMIVWGGVAYDPYPNRTNDAGRYDPLLDSWTPTNMSGAPTARSSHTAVWTGTEMIIWGGSRVSGWSSFENGARYLPSTDSWIPMSTSGSPPVRSGHTAVWTGKVMLTWGGGSRQLDPLYRGGGYDPQGDDWTLLETSGAPSRRYGHTAVLTDTEMIIWGGTDDKLESLYEGSRYCHLTCAFPNTWYQDLDGDGYGTTATRKVSCDPISGYVLEGGDCNDSDPTIHPGVLETCNAIDDDCNGLTDEQLGSTTCGVGACSRTVQNCVDGSQQVCIPGTPSAEVCNGIDDDCNAVLDDGLGPGDVTVSLNPGLLWPPNHRMVAVHATVGLTGGCPSACPAPPLIFLDSAVSYEPDDAIGTGDGHTINDIQDATINSPDFDLMVRAERSHGGEGRVYQITYTATDCFADVAVGKAALFVPHDQGGITEPLLLSLLDSPTGSTLSWNPVPGAVSYRVIRGNVGHLRDETNFFDLGTVSCIQSDMQTTSTLGHEDIDDPPRGEAFFYLGSYHDGVDSGYGIGSAIKPRLTAAGDCGSQSD